MSKVSPIPPGPRLIPYLSVRSAPDALAFYQRVFGFEQRQRIVMDDGRVGHAELRLGDARLYLADEFPEIGIVGPASVGGTSVSILLYVEDVDAVVATAEAAGASLETSPEDAFFGERTAKLRDPFGHRWMIHSRIEELDADEVQSRFEQAPSEL